MTDPDAPADRDRGRRTDAVLAAALLAVDPVGLGGAAVRAGAGPVRDGWLSLLRFLLPEGAPWRRVPCSIGDEALLGGLDLSATLRAGKPVVGRGVLAEADGGVVLLAMAERLGGDTAGRLAAVLDAREVRLERDGIGQTSPARLAMLALDEGIEEDERPPRALTDRLAFLLDLDGLRADASGDIDRDDIAAARALLPTIRSGEDALEALCAASLALGVWSLRAPLLALRAARASAALFGRTAVDTDDITLAARLVLGPRATCLPATESAEEEPTEEEQPPEQPPPDQPPEQNQDNTDIDPQDLPPLEDLVLAAAQAAIPPGLLARLKVEQRMRAQGKGGKAGADQTGGGRGRPAGTRRGEPRRGQRLNVIETLRAAAPWQTVRRRLRPRTMLEPVEQSAAPCIAVAKDDFRVTRMKRRSQTTTIFVVDASGSAAFQRLAEAKGAVEMLLSDCYVRRDEVALLAFRGEGAELLLPPTRSLVRAKRSLADLPGGGGTPLATAIAAAAELADGIRRRGATPAIVFLTDGRGNIARDGSRGRAKAGEDALTAARALRAAGLAAILVDTSPWPEPAAQRLAEEMDAVYLPLPRADAATLSGAVRGMSAPASRAA